MHRLYVTPVDTRDPENKRRFRDIFQSSRFPTLASLQGLNSDFIKDYDSGGFRAANHFDSEMRADKFVLILELTELTIRHQLWRGTRVL